MACLLLVGVLQCVPVDYKLILSRFKLAFAKEFPANQFKLAADSVEVSLNRDEVTKTFHMLDGTVEVDETYIGGRARGVGTGNYRDSKAVVIGIIQRSGDLKFIHVAEGTSKAIREVMEEHVSEDVDVIVTDESVLYNSGLPKTQRSKRQSVNHKAEEYVRYENGFMVTTNTVESAFSLFKRGIVGSWHRVSPKHLAAYLNEMTFRFNRRKSHTLFLDTLRHMVTAPVLTFERLTA